MKKPSNHLRKLQALVGLRRLGLPGSTGSHCHHEELCVTYCMFGRYKVRIDRKMPEERVKRSRPVTGSGHKICKGAKAVAASSLVF